MNQYVKLDRHRAIGFVLACMCCLFIWLEAAAAEPLIAVASDLHMDELTRDKGLVNPLVPIHPRIIDALLDDVLEQGADMLLLCGDITNQGKFAQHEQLLERLQNARARGLNIYVLPGNHDIGQVLPMRFAAMYKDFGYGDAYSRDPDSLSYSVLEDGLLILMLDTHGYADNGYVASIDEGTLHWMEGQLVTAKRYGWRVLAAGHYPILTEQATKFTGKAEAVRLLEKYDVPLYICGHLHGRNVAVGEKLVELVIDQAISYPCCYALLEGTEGGWRYRPRKIDVSGWLAKNGETDPRLLDFDVYQTELARQRSEETVAGLRGDQEIAEEDYRQAVDFFWQMSDYGARGVLNHYADQLREHPGYAIFIKIAGSSIYARWVPSVLGNTTPYEEGFQMNGTGIFLLPTP